MSTVFLLWHRHATEFDEDDEHEKLIGVYASEADAAAALGRVKKMPGFRDYPDGFVIEGYEIGKDQNWAEGFVTWQQSLDAIDRANTQ